MSRSFRFDDPFFPVPAAAVDADPAATIAELYFRVARLEQALEEQRQGALAEQAELLLSQVDIADALVRLAESIGVPTSAQQAMLARGVAELGKQFMADLERRGVTPIEALGRSLEKEHSDAVAYEPSAEVDEGVVLREVQPGYLWRGNVLRRAQVVVSGRPPSEGEGVADGQPPKAHTADSQVRQGAKGR